jgi:hypothetical protein
VKAVLERDDAVARRALRVPVAPRKLQRRLDRFRAAVAEERSRQAGERRQPRRQLPLQRVEEQIRRVQQFVRLRGDGRGETRMRMAERGHADPGDEIQIGAARRVEQAAAAATLEHDRRPAVDLQDVR